MAGYNPIQSVGGVTVPCPSSYAFKLSDISAADAGRTEDTTMDKMKIGQVVHLELSWGYLTDEQVQTVLNAFDAEYFQVTYRNAKTNSFETSWFYAGDRTAALYNSTFGLWSNVSFNIIERKGRS